MSAEELTVYEVMEKSRDNPDDGPDKPPAKGMWVWWRTGPHPRGVWQAMDTTTKAWGEAYRENERLHKPWQDRALGEPSDFGNVVCHACGEMSEGYPEPRHKTVCDGVCRRHDCRAHRDRKTVVYELAENDHRKGLFLSVEGAKHRAQEILDGYEALEREQALLEAKGEERDMQEFTVLPGQPLEWRMMQHYLHSLPSEGDPPPKPRTGPPMGKPVLTAIYAERSWFTIHEREVRP